MAHAVVTGLSFGHQGPSTARRRLEEQLCCSRIIMTRSGGVYVARMNVEPNVAYRRWREVTTDSSANRCRIRVHRDHDRPSRGVTRPPEGTAKAGARLND